MVAGHATDLPDHKSICMACFLYSPYETIRAAGVWNYVYLALKISDTE